MSNNRYFIEFSYDGSSYHGLQKQLNAITVQEIMENAVSLEVPNKVDYECGPNWGNIKEEDKL